MNKTDQMNKLSKNKDVTRLVNFRLRVSDLNILDNFAKWRNLSRTAALELLITNNCLSDCLHDWMTFDDGSKICKFCKTIQ